MSITITEITVIIAIATSCCMRLEDPETPSGSQLSPHVSNPSGIAAQQRQSSAWATTGQDVEHRAINKVTTLTEPLPYIETSP